MCDLQLLTGRIIIDAIQQSKSNPQKFDGVGSAHNMQDPRTLGWIHIRAQVQ